MWPRYGTGSAILSFTSGRNVSLDGFYTRRFFVVLIIKTLKLIATEEEEKINTADFQGEESTSGEKEAGHLLLCPLQQTCQMKEADFSFSPPSRQVEETVSKQGKNTPGSKFLPPPHILLETGKGSPFLQAKPRPGEILQIGAT